MISRRQIIGRGQAEAAPMSEQRLAKPSKAQARSRRPSDECLAAGARAREPYRQLARSAPGDSTLLSSAPNKLQDPYDACYQDYSALEGAHFDEPEADESDAPSSYRRPQPQPAAKEGSASFWSRSQCVSQASAAMSRHQLAPAAAQAAGSGHSSSSAGNSSHNSNSNQDAASSADHYRQFDPYAIYSEEDVWYSEERLLEVSEGLRRAVREP